MGDQTGNPKLKLTPARILRRQATLTRTLAEEILDARLNFLDGTSHREVAAYLQKWARKLEERADGLDRDQT
mgnify:CR=1 FL=1